MSYPESERDSSTNRFLGEGFKVEPDFRVEPDYRHESGESVYDPTTVPIAGSGFGTSAPSSPVAGGDADARISGLTSQTTALELPPGPAPSVAELHNAFDDPQHGEPGRDRFGVHAIWEAVLLVATIGVAVAVNQKTNLDGDAVHGLMVLATVYGLLALGAGLTLRAGAVNLALGPIMIGSGLFFGRQWEDHGSSVTVAAVITLAIAAGIGVVIALVVALAQVPGWAVSLAAFLGVDVWISHLPPHEAIRGGSDVLNRGVVIFTVFAIVAVVGALIGTIRPVRRAIGRLRPVSDPADRRGGAAVWTTGIAIVVSSLFAGVAGILEAASTHAATADTGLTWSAAAVGIALVGGTSAYGRRGGVFGTVLATCLFVLIGYYGTLANYRIDERVIIGAALVIGVIITRVVETYGRPRRAYGTEVSTTGWLGGSSSTDVDRPAGDWGDSGGDPWGTR